MRFQSFRETFPVYTAFLVKIFQTFSARTAPAAPRERSYCYLEYFTAVNCTPIACSLDRSYSAKHNPAFAALTFRTRFDYCQYAYSSENPLEIRSATKCVSSIRVPTRQEGLTFGLYKRKTVLLSVRDRKLSHARLIVGQ